MTVIVIIPLIGAGLRSICGVKAETIEDPMTKKMRQLDKLVDELAKGKPLEKVIR
ncbi:MAG: DUF2200 family protein [Clostridia bacterium]|nr:DUF2200 family protein [Clostridia bacterium]